MIDPLTHYIYRDAGRHGPVILMYHSVASGSRNPQWPWAVSMQRFRSQLDFLAGEGWATPTIAELIASPHKWNGRTAAITFDDGYVDNIAAAEEILRRGQRASWFIVTGSIGKYPAWPDMGRPSDRLLNADEMRNLYAAGLEIGSHGVSHIRLPKADDYQLQMELTNSKTTLENELGARISSFAYPYGAWDKRCADAVKEAGYQTACTTRTGWTLVDGNPYQLRRLTIFNTDTLNSFIRKLCFADNDVSWRAMARYATRRLIPRRKR